MGFSWAWQVAGLHRVGWWGEGHNPACPLEPSVLSSFHPGWQNAAECGPHARHIGVCYLSSASYYQAPSLEGRISFIPIRAFDRRGIAMKTRLKVTSRQAAGPGSTPRSMGL